jgi:glycosyltransferase involved in cell wall biosynthesis
MTDRSELLHTALPERRSNTRRLPISVLILSFNEEPNLAQTLDSLQGWVERIIVVDSHSSDNTIQIAESYGCDILQHEFKNHAMQFNWGLQQANITSQWTMRLDADERVTLGLWEELSTLLPRLATDTTGLLVRRQVYFMSRWIRHGGYYPTWLLRVWRSGAAVCEERWMDEHIKLIEGAAIYVKQDIIDENRKPLTWWIAKHNGYATREAIDLISLKEHFLHYDSIPARIWGTQDQRKRWLKEQLYARTPLFIRPAAYFFLRYVVKLGFLDGAPGLIWHFLQGFWYRFLVDAKIYEITRKSRLEGITMKEAIEALHGVKL